MKTVIYKYELNIGKTTIQAPGGATPLMVDVQHGDPYIWLLCPVDGVNVDWQLEVIGTGHEFEHYERAYPLHLGSFMLNDGSFVGHVFRT